MELNNPLNWRLRRSLPYAKRTPRSPITVIGLQRGLVRFDVSCPTRKANWYRAGYLNQVIQGFKSGSGQVVPFESKLFNLPASEPYNLIWTPVSWLPDGIVRVYEWALDLTDADYQTLSQFDGGAGVASTQVLRDEINRVAQNPDWIDFS